MTSLSAVIITVNQEKKIAKTIEALKALTNDIVVVDSGSTDLTRKVARAAGANVLERPWTGILSRKTLVISGQNMIGFYPSTMTR